MAAVVVLVKEEEEQGKLPNLPWDIIKEILTWLLVKSLCRFREHDRSSMAIISFLLDEEIVQEIPLPPAFDISIGDEDENYLSVFEECLCMGKRYDREFWIMKEYGVTKSWTKIGIPMPFSETLHTGFVKKNHHLMLVEPRDGMEQQQLVLYNFNGGSIGKLSIRGICETGTTGV